MKNDLNLPILIKDGPYSVEWDYIGEGCSGDYDPSDPTDQQLLRFTVFVNGNEVTDGSYCTLLTVDAKRDRIEAVSKEILLAAAYMDYKRRLEALSWSE